MPTRPAENSTTLTRRLTAYSAIAAATSAVSGVAGANEVVWDITDITVTDPGGELDVNSVFFNMANGAATVNTNTAVFTTEGRLRMTPDFNGYIYGPTINSAAGNLGFVGVVNQYTYTSTGGATSTYTLAGANPLAANVTVAPGDPFVVSGPFQNKFYAYLSFSDGVTGTIGIRFDLNNNVHYGWAQITRVDDDNFTLHGFGYNDTPGATSTAVDTIDPAGPAADLSGDGDVDDEDLGLFFSAFTGPDNGPSLDPRADLSGDGDVDDEDLGQAFSEFTGPLGPANVPEPASLVLLAMGAAGLATRRGR